MKDSLFGVSGSVSAHVEPLRVNSGWRRMSLLSVMERSLSISVELCLTVLFLLFFHTVASTSSLSVFIVPLLALLVLLSLLASRPLPSPSPALLALAYVLTPVLASLARSVARDTLASTVRLLLVARLAFRDFTATDPRPLVAANAGLLSAILLCSRLDAYLQVFSVVLLGILLFALWPVLLVRATQLWPRFPCVLAIVLAIVTLALLFATNQPPILIGSFLLVLSTANIIAPLLFYKLQSLKHVLSGQWKEAQV